MEKHSYTFPMEDGEAYTTTTRKQRRSRSWTRPSRETCLIFVIALLLCFIVGTGSTSIWNQRTRPFSFTSATTSSSSIPASGSNHGQINDDAVLVGDFQSKQWLSTFTAAPQFGPADLLFPDGFYDEGIALANTTVRQTHRLAIGGTHFRVRLSNTFTLAGLTVDKSFIALTQPESNGRRDETTLSGSSSVRTDSMKQLTFNGEESLRVPAHGDSLSDPVEIELNNGDIVSITMYFKRGLQADRVTCHMAPRTPSWAVHGDQTDAQNLIDLGAASFPHSITVSAIETWVPTSYRGVLAVGDSITDGRSMSMRSEGRWSNHLFDRFQRSESAFHRTLSVVNQAIGGTQVIWDGKGPSLMSRLDRDVLAASGIRYVVLLMGINDINVRGGKTPEEQRVHDLDLLAQYRQIVTRLHSANIVVFGGTITPFSCLHDRNPGHNADNPVKDASRVWINERIRNDNIFDAVVDFDEMLRDPSNHTEMLPRFQSGDCLHPQDAGYRHMATQFPIELFEKFKNGVSRYR